MLSRHSAGTRQGNELTRNSYGNAHPRSSQLAKPLWLILAERMELFLASWLICIKGGGGEAQTGSDSSPSPPKKKKKKKSHYCFPLFFYLTEMVNFLSSMYVFIFTIMLLAW